MIPKCQKIEIIKQAIVVKIKPCTVLLHLVLLLSCHLPHYILPQQYNTQNLSSKMDIENWCVSVIPKNADFTFLRKIKSTLLFTFFFSVFQLLYSYTHCYPDAAFSPPPPPNPQRNWWTVFFQQRSSVFPQKITVFFRRKPSCHRWNMPFWFFNHLSIFVP